VISLPYPPTVNTYYTVARGRKILSTAGRSFKKQALLSMMEQNVPKGRDGCYAVMIHMMPPDNRKRDVDNIIKPILDSLVEYGALPDDSMVHDLRIQRFDATKGGAVTVNLCRE